MTSTSTIPTFSDEEKKRIAQQIKPISLERAILDYKKLKSIILSIQSGDINLARCRVGNDFVDHFTFTERLNTRGKYGIHFYDFVANIETFKQKQFIKNMLVYYETEKNKNGTKNQMVVYKEVYNICISAINIIKPAVLIDLFMNRFAGTHKIHTILDMTMGWGGSLLAAVVSKIPHYVGIDLNHHLREGYERMVDVLQKEEGGGGEGSKMATKIDLYFQSALDFDYSTITYDFVFTSPPYFFIEKYSNNKEYESKPKMIEEFYKPLIRKTFAGLQLGGIYCLSINREIYEAVCLGVLGEATQQIELSRSKRQNNYTEYIYVWRKN